MLLLFTKIHDSRMYHRQTLPVIVKYCKSEANSTDTDKASYRYLSLWVIVKHYLAGHSFSIPDVHNSSAQRTFQSL